MSGSVGAHVRDALKRLEERSPILADSVVYAGSIVFSLIIFAIFLLAMGYDPLRAFYTMMKASFGSIEAFSHVIAKLIPLWLCGLACAIAFKASFWNIGAEGQLYWGAIAFTFVGLFVECPGPLRLLLGLILAFIAGAIWDLIPGALKAYLNIFEVIVTIMLNYVAFLMVEYLITGPWKDPFGYEPISYEISQDAMLPILVPRTTLHAGLIIAIIIAIIASLIMLKMRLGYEIRVVGANPKAARIGGINVAKTVVIASLLSGGVAGIAGAIEISAMQHRLLMRLSPGYGFMGIIVAILAKNHPVWSVLSALLLAIIFVGVDALQRTMAVPIGAVFTLQALIALCVVVFTHFLRGS